MSINRAVVALGAVAVVGVATLGFSIPYAVHAGKPVPNAAITAGSDWVQAAPLKACWDKGNALDSKSQTACVAALNAEIKNNTVHTVPVNANGTILLNVDKLAADKGWTAFALGSSTSTTLVNETKNQAGGPIPVSSLFAATSTSQATNQSYIRIVVGDGSSKVYGVWQFELKAKS